MHTLTFTAQTYLNIKYFEIYKFDLKKVYETVFEMDLYI